MDDSLKYGVPAGLIAYVAFLLLPPSEVQSLWRWLIVAVTVLVISLLSIRQKNQLHFPFSFAFLSGFNISIVMLLIHSVLLIFLGHDSFPPAPSEDVVLKWRLFQVFQEAVGFLFIQLILLGIASAIFMRRKRRG